jgi:hypothetical protein
MPPSPPTSSGDPRPARLRSAGPVVLPLVPGSRRPGGPRPLPDAAAVRLSAVPDSAPPYDDDLAEAGPGGADGAQPTPLVPRPGPAGAQPTPLAPRPGPAGAQPTPLAPRPGPAGAQPTPLVPRPGAAGSGGKGATGRGEPEPAAWPGRFAQVLAETLAGSRPQGQIRPWTTDQALRRIRQLGPMLAAGAAPRVRRIVTSRPAAGVVEMSVIVAVGPSVRALAVRLEHDAPPGADPARWVCTAVEAA